MGKTIEIIDLNGLAKEIYSYLHMYVFNSTTLQQCQQQFLIDLEYVLEMLIRVIIDNNSHRIIRTNLATVTEDLLINFCHCYSLDKPNFELVLDDLYSIAYVLDKVELLTKENPFNLWVLTKVNGIYTFECMGDIRIITWEKEHFIDGIYKP